MGRSVGDKRLENRGENIGNDKVLESDQVLNEGATLGVERGHSGAEDGRGGGLIRHDVSNVAAELPPREQEVSLREGDQLIQQSEYTK